MKTLTLVFILSLASCNPAIANINIKKMADAIYLAEGGTKTRFPFGVKSVPCSGYDECRKITINSVRNNIVRWDSAGNPRDFISFMASRWCPESVDPEGHKNWIRNVNYFYKEG